ncbi:MAG: BamA/TamA family outer membrane protein [Bacteroidia bacterium]|nr:BamA/TamA family outer membrane protein [Bacteroidia bacterium]
MTGYDYGNIADTITILNPYYYCYGKKISRFFSSSATWKRDKRDSRYYPLKGYLSSVTLSKFGLGTIYDDINIIMTEGTINNYLLLFRYLYYASGIHLRLSHNFNNDEYPYTLIKALGYENNLRGYDYYIIDGQHFIIIKQSLKYKLLSASEREIKFIPLEKFRKIYYATYCEIFFETGYVYNHNEHPTVNSMENRLLYGGGIGFTFSSYYDWVFRLEYSLNHLFESGFFIHLGAPI